MSLFNTTEGKEKEKRKYANIKNFLEGPTLIQRSDAKEVEIVDEDKGNSFINFINKSI